MREAIALGRVAAFTDDVPVGAIVVAADGEILSRGRNEREAHGDPTAHAEIVAIRAAARALDRSRLDGCTLITTLEPCAMCAGAILQARISTVVYGAWDEKAGAAGSVYDLLRDGRLPATTEVVAGVLADECADPIRRFFRSVPGRASDEAPEPTA
ncbi:nucleoside deaminase [Pseudoclavibacter chungangensis]|uniref:tRNA-specific adenosine deaminase n=2 Tax=Pseudoclavibacter chungangensis TaxID=587635 RepID=A0A7J5BQA1_9MICO|nr:nucleoside deaminase [Pseudoclavibacter chungangensis]